MKLTKLKRPVGCEVNMAPLIDLTFLLIIFFMTVSQISRVEVQSLNLPEAQSGKSKTLQLSGKVIVNVPKDGRIIVSGRNCTLSSLDSHLAKVVAQRGAEKVSVLVRGDRDISWETAGSVLKVASARGIKNVRVAVVKAGKKH